MFDNTVAPESVLLFPTAAGRRRPHYQTGPLTAMRRRLCGQSAIATRKPDNRQRRLFPDL